MSYGRRPHYIYQREHERGPFVFDGASEVEYDAMAQFIATIFLNMHDEFDALLARGQELRPELKGAADVDPPATPSLPKLN